MTYDDVLNCVRMIYLQGLKKDFQFGLSFLKVAIWSVQAIIVRLLHLD